MRMIAVNIGDTRITFDNCMWTGYEYIRVNGRIISKAFSWIGMDHIFEIKEDGEWIEYIVRTGMGIWCTGTRITRDGIIIADTRQRGEEINVSRTTLRTYRESELV